MMYGMAAGNPLCRCQHCPKNLPNIFNASLLKNYKMELNTKNLNIGCHSTLHLLRFTRMCSGLSISLLELTSSLYHQPHLSWSAITFFFFIWHLIPFQTFYLRLYIVLYSQMLGLFGLSLCFTHLICFFSPSVYPAQFQLSCFIPCFPHHLMVHPVPFHGFPCQAFCLVSQSGI